MQIGPCWAQAHTQVFVLRCLWHEGAEQLEISCNTAAEECVGGNLGTKGDIGNWVPVTVGREGPKPQKS